LFNLLKIFVPSTIFLIGNVKLDRLVYLGKILPFRKELIPPVLVAALRGFLSDGFLKIPATTAPLEGDAPQRSGGPAKKGDRAGKPCQTEQCIVSVGGQ
jgi:hypothetical protein